MSASNQLAAFNYAVQPLGNLQIKNITAAYTVSPSDNNFILNCTSGTFTIAMPPATSLPSGFNFTVWNTGTGTITIDANGSETIGGFTTYVLARETGVQIICDGTNWQFGYGRQLRTYAENGFSSLPTASGSDSVAIGRSAAASGTSAYAFGRSTVASATASTAIGLTSSLAGSQAVTGSGAMALGGSYASGTDSFAAGVANNTSTYGAQGANGISIGQITRATGTNSIGIGKGVISSNTQSVAIGGTSTNSSGSGAFALGSSFNVGFGANSSGTDSFAFGDCSAARETKKIAFAGWGVVQGGAQAGLIVLTRSTTDATATVLTSDTATASNSNQVILPNNSAYAFTGTIIARQQAAGGSNYAAWEVKGAILRDATAASTVLGSYNINALSATAGASAWVVALSADTTNGGLAVTVTGAASVNIRWVATIKTSEVTYA